MGVIILDTEGLGGTNTSKNNDSKIFLLAHLLCSMFIYNSMGIIDE
jgi:hypothetical protein